ncbi:MAG: response regulator, partial [Aliifodinibius sp.]|nr:response regulator transcription factor [Fodinibius sp.]NIV11587.1 response regulator [Fodinibius sp.]NIY25196.1 response regulator [Fodinibius sp.]
YTVHCAGNGMEAIAIFQNEYVDLIILDLMMPHMNGLDTIRRIREKSIVPILVLSALGEEKDKIQALELGADDYLTKPFGVGELLARVKAAERRSRWSEHKPHPSSKIIHENIKADLDRHIVTVNGDQVVLTPTEFDLLVYFMQNKNKILYHEFILKNVWGPEYGQESEYLRVYVGRLRQKIETDPSNPRYLHTERGVGYCFETR